MFNINFVVCWFTFFLRGNHQTLGWHYISWENLTCFEIPIFSSWHLNYLLCICKFYASFLKTNNCLTNVSFLHPLKTRENLRFFGVFKGYKIVTWSRNGIKFNPSSSNPTKWSNTLKQFVGKWPTNCLCVFDHFVGLELEGLMILTCQSCFTRS